MPNENYDVIKISDNSWRIEEAGVRSFVFAGTERALLVDTGFGSGNIKQIVGNLTNMPVMLVNTHADGDHLGCNKLFDAAHMHPAEFAYYFETAPADAKVSPLWEGDIIDLGGRKFEALLIPGHTPGSVALLDRENRILVAGDSISGGPIFMFGKHRSFPAFISSMQKLLKISGSFDTIYPSHGSFPQKPDMIGKLIYGAERVMKGDIQPQEPPFELPAKMYQAGDAAFFY